jgi:hypothetical protein
MKYYYKYLSDYKGNFIFKLKYFIIFNENNNFSIKIVAQLKEWMSISAYFETQ